MGIKQDIIDFYDQQYKKLFWIPILILLGAFIAIGLKVALTGDFVNKGIDLKGGSTITVLDNAPEGLEENLNEEFSGEEINVRTLTERGRESGFTVTTTIQDNDRIDVLTAYLEDNFQISEDDYTVEVIGATLGNSFFKQTLIALGVAFLFMALVVFLYFRTLVPSSAIVLAAFSDIVVSLAIFNLIGARLSTSSIAGFLMLVGYSVDTDILLTSRIIKRKEGTVFERLLGAIKTGMTMTITTIVALLVAYFLTNSVVIKQIMLILLIGLSVDIINTWIQNAAIIRWYAEG